jgi:hypothetical protein
LFYLNRYFTFDGCLSIYILIYSGLDGLFITLLTSDHKSNTTDVGSICATQLSNTTDVGSICATQLSNTTDVGSICATQLSNTTDVGSICVTQLNCQGFQTPTHDHGFYQSFMKYLSWLSSTNKSNGHNINEILQKVTLNTNNIF